MDLHYWLATKIFKKKCSRYNYKNEYCIAIDRIFSSDLLNAITIGVGVVTFSLNGMIFGKLAFTFEDIKPILEVILRQSEQSRELLPLINWNGWIFGGLSLLILAIVFILLFIIDEYYSSKRYLYQNQKVENL